MVLTFAKVISISQRPEILQMQDILDARQP